MDRAEYNSFVSAYYEGMKREGIFSIVEVRDDENDTHRHFSHSRCDICRRPLEGDRTECNGLFESERVNIAVLAHNRIPIVFDVCDDCIYFHEYGKLDDQTMMEIENG